MFLPQALLNVETMMSNGFSAVQIVRYVVTEKSLREASSQAQQNFSAFRVEMAMKKDVFDNLLIFQVVNS
jgi:hypothetical protein